MVERWHPSNIQSNVAICYMEISNWRTNKLKINLWNIPRGDVSLEDATATCFLTEFHVALALVQPVYYRCDQWESMWHFFFLFFQGKLQQANKKYGQTLKVPQSTGPSFQEDLSSKRIWNMSKLSRKRPTKTWTQN